MNLLILLLRSYTIFFTLYSCVLIYVGVLGEHDCVY